ncbi:MAG: hypothetical protein U9O94_03255 [Nanoarchaeota archaeon]|nr:hypothetical protein [Nanoarchaeota archaeon]
MATFRLADKTHLSNLELDDKLLTEDTSDSDITKYTTPADIKTLTDVEVLSASGVLQNNITTTSGILQTNINNVPIDTEEYFTLTSGQISNKYITLAHTPLTAGEVAFDIINGCSQFYDEGYSVSSANVTWDGLGLDGLLEEDDKIRIMYSY